MCPVFEVTGAMERGMAHQGVFFWTVQPVGEDLDKAGVLRKLPVVYLIQAMSPAPLTAQNLNKGPF